MKRLYLILLICWAMLSVASAQELTVKSMTVAGNDISASQYERKDLNGQASALVKVLLASPGAVFEGNVIGDVVYKTGEYWVYLSAGSKELRIKHPQTQPLQVVFKEYGTDKVSAKMTYNLSVLLPETPQTQTQKLVINYSPANATVLVDSKLQQGNGHIEIVLPVGSHDYIIAADGYATAEGSVKLTTDGSRTINETLTAIVATQQIVDQQASHQQSTVQQSNHTQSATSTSFSSSSSSSAASVSVSVAAVETFTVKGVSFNMVRVDGGTFMMGCEDGDAKKNEKPVHEVTLSSYSIGETEVTQALWQAVMGKNPSNFKGDNLPVESMTWKDCQEFIENLNSLTGKRFRLPTEAEWEYAARGGSKSHGYKYSGSDSIDDVAWFWENSGDSRLSGEYKSRVVSKNNCRTHPVKSKQSNELGLYDMSGNVWEWCHERLGDYPSTPQTNPMGASGVFHPRLIRGGSYFCKMNDCRSSNRYGMGMYRGVDLGLRLAL